MILNFVELSFCYGCTLPAEEILLYEMFRKAKIWSCAISLFHFEMDLISVHIFGKQDLKSHAEVYGKMCVSNKNDN